MDEESVQDSSTFLLGNPLNFGTAEAGVQGLRGSQGWGTHLVGARAHTHLEGHLGRVLSMGLRVFKSGQEEESKKGLWEG